MHVHDEPDASLTLRRLFPYPRERVWRAWTDPEALRQWFGPPGYGTPEAEVDLRTGGHYRLGMQKLPDGSIFYVSGTFLEVRPPERLVYTWQWDEVRRGAGETLVTVEFRDRGGKTEVVLTHARFLSEADRQRHRQGWEGCLDKLEAHLG